MEFLPLDFLRERLADREELVDVALDEAGDHPDVLCESVGRRIGGGLHLLLVINDSGQNLFFQSIFGGNRIFGQKRWLAKMGAGKSKVINTKTLSQQCQIVIYVD